MSQIQQAGTPKNLSASGTISVASCSIIGYHVNSTSGGTLVFRVGSDGGAGGTAVNAATTPVQGFNAFPMYAPAGAYLTISGTIDVTVFVAAG